MTPREELFSQAIQTVWEERRQERLARLPIGKWWEIIKEEVISPALDEAVKALGSNALHGEHIPKNGSGEQLEADSLEGPPSRLTLSFELSGEEIRVESSEADLKALWDRGSVTEEVVDARVVAFLKRVAGKHPKPPGLSSGIR